MKSFFVVVVLFFFVLSVSCLGNFKERLAEILSKKEQTLLKGQKVPLNRMASKVYLGLLQEYSELEKFSYLSVAPIERIISSIVDDKSEGFLERLKSENSIKEKSQELEKFRKEILNALLDALKKKFSKKDLKIQRKDQEKSQNGVEIQPNFAENQKSMLNGNLNKKQISTKMTDADKNNQPQFNDFDEEKENNDLTNLDFLLPNELPYVQSKEQNEELLSNYNREMRSNPDYYASRAGVKLSDVPEENSVVSDSLISFEKIEAECASSEPFSNPNAEFSSENQSFAKLTERFSNSHSKKQASNDQKESINVPQQLTSNSYKRCFSYFLTFSSKVQPKKHPKKIPTSGFLHSLKNHEIQVF